MAGKNGSEMVKVRFSDAQLRVLEKGTIECKDVVRLLGDYTDKELSTTLKARLDAHIQNCSECREVRDSYKWTVDIASHLEEKPISNEIQNRLRSTLNEKLGINLPMVG